MKQFYKIMALLQLFAELNTQVTTQDSLSGEMKSYYDTELLKMAEPKLVHQQFFKKSALPKGRGKTIEWRKWGDFEKATTPLTEGVTPDGKGLSVETVTCEIKQYGDYSAISDMLEMTAVDDVVLEYTDKHGSNMGITMDTIARNEMSAQTNVSYAPALTIDAGGNVTAETPVASRGAITNACHLTPKLIARVAAYLRGRNAEPLDDGNYACVIHPYVGYDLMRNPEFIEAHKYAQPKELYLGEIGLLNGVRFVQTTEAKIWKGAALRAAGETITGPSAQAAASSGTATTDVTVQSAIVTGDRILSASAANPIWLNVGGTEYKCVGATAGAAGAAKITLQQPHAAVAANAVIYPGGAGANNAAVFSCEFVAKDMGRSIDLGENARTIVKQRGSAGSADPLDQRSTVGWKAAYAAKVTIPEYLYRVECGSDMGAEIAKEN